MVIELFDPLLFQPFFRVCELTDRSIDIELASS